MEHIDIDYAGLIGLGVLAGFGFVLTVFTFGFVLTVFAVISVLSGV